ARTFASTRSLGGLAPVAIRAAHLAFRDLHKDPSPRPAAVRVLRDVGDLAVQVVGLERDDVLLAAVDARMTGEVLDQNALGSRYGAPRPIRTSLAFSR